MATSELEKESQRFVMIRQVRDLSEALLFKTILDSASIECFLGDENTIRMDWLWSNLLSGVKICVRKADADAALTLLERRAPEGFDVEGVGEYQQPRCPKCGSLDISFQGLNKPVAYGSILILGFPVLLHRSVWECDSCRHRWPDSNDQSPDKSPPSGSA